MYIRIWWKKISVASQGKLAFPQCRLRDLSPASVQPSAAQHRRKCCKEFKKWSKAQSVTNAVRSQSPANRSERAGVCLLSSE